MSPRVVLALSASDIAKTLGSDSRVLASTGVRSLPSGDSLLPGRSVAVGEDVPALRVADFPENLPERLDQRLTGVVEAKVRDASPLAVDADIDTAVAIFCVVGAAISKGVVEGVGDDASAVSVSGVDLFPGLLEEVKVSNVNLVVAVADLNLDQLAQGGGSQGSEDGESELHGLVTLARSGQNEDYTYE